MVEDYTNVSGEIRNQEDEEVENLTNALEKQQEAYEEVDAQPPYAEKDDLWGLFWKVIKADDSSKVSNLDLKTELGIPNINVRDCQRIAMLGNYLGHPGFARYFWMLGQITLSTSASKRGWLVDNFVTSKKFSAKERVSNLPQLQPVKKKKFKIF